MYSYQPLQTELLQTMQWENGQEEGPGEKKNEKKGKS